MKQKKFNPYILEVYSESLKRKLFVGVLSFDPETRIYKFEYDRKYRLRKRAVPLGPELSLRRGVHASEPGKIFPSLLDRIPSKQNPAYAEYCKICGIDIKEENPIVLLGTIGRKGPSSFVFESLPAMDIYTPDRLKALMKGLDLSTWAIATAFDIPELTIQKTLNSRSHDRNIITLIEIFLRFSEVALWKLEQTGRKLPSLTRARLTEYFQS